MTGNDTGTTTTLSYTPNTNKLASSARTGLNRVWNYDANGNTQSFAGADGVAVGFSYDALNRMVASSRNTVNTAYTINALGQRSSKIGPNGTSQYVYSPDGLLLSENSNGNWTNYIYFGGEPVAMIRGGVLRFMHNDQLGRPEVITDANKAVQWQARNDAFNRTVLTDNIGGLNIGFPGQYYDSETGTWYNGFRDYDASTGRSLQSDPIGLQGGINTYGYALQNPINNVDPLGLDTISCALTGNCKSGDIPKIGEIKDQCQAREASIKEAEKQAKLIACLAKKGGEEAAGEIAAYVTVGLIAEGFSLSGFPQAGGAVALGYTVWNASKLSKAYTAVQGVRGISDCLNVAGY